MNAHTETLASPVRALASQAPTISTPDRDIVIPWPVAIAAVLTVWAGLFGAGYAVGHAQAPVHTVTVDQTYTGQQIAACIAHGLCPAH